MRRDLTDADKEKFLELYRQSGNITRSCESLGISRRTITNWRHNDAEFAVEFAEAKEELAELLIDEAHRRAREGFDEPVFHQGQQCGVVRKYSDTLLIFLLKGLMPETFRERSDHRVTGGDGGPLRIVEEIVVEPPTQDDSFARGPSSVSAE